MTDLTPESDQSPFTPRVRRRGQMYALLTNLNTNVTGIILYGPMMVLYATKVLGLKASEIAGIMGASAFLPALQLVTLPLVPRFGKRRLVTLNMLCMTLLTVPLLFITPAALGSHTAVLICFGGLLILIRAFRQGFHNAVWQPLLKDITTIDDRGRFFSRMRAAFYGTSLLLLGACTLTLGKDITQGQYRWMLLLVIVMGLSSTAFSTGIPSREPPGQRAIGLREYVRVVTGSRVFRRPLVVVLLCWTGTFRLFVLYMSNVLLLPDSLVSLYTFLLTVSIVVSLMFWGRITDRIGYRTALRGILYLHPVLAALLVFLKPLPLGPDGSIASGAAASLSIGLVMAFGVALGALQAGVGICVTSIYHHAAQPQDADVSLPLVTMVLFWWEAVLDAVFGVVVALTQRTGGWSHGPFHLDPTKFYGILIVAVLLITARVAVKLPKVREADLGDFYRLLLRAVRLQPPGASGDR